MSQPNKTENRKSIRGHLNCGVRRIFDPLILLCYGYRPAILWLNPKRSLMSRASAIKEAERDHCKFKDVI